MTPRSSRTWPIPTWEPTPGNQSVFNAAWNAMVDSAAAESTRRTIEYLLHGPDNVPREDRLQQALDGTKSFAMTGFNEALLTSVLCVVEPERFLSILIRHLRRLAYQALEAPTAPRTPSLLAAPWAGPSENLRRLRQQSASAIVSGRSYCGRPGQLSSTGGQCGETHGG